VSYAYIDNDTIVYSLKNG